MVLTSFASKTAIAAIALILLSHPSAAIAGTLNYTEQPVPERDLDFTGQVILFETNYDDISLSLALLSSNHHQSPLLSLFTSTHLFQAMTLVGDWQRDTQVSRQDTSPPQWAFQPTGWTNFR